jgi:hypothetical protein
MPKPHIHGAMDFGRLYSPAESFRPSEITSWRAESTPSLFT